METQTDAALLKAFQDGNHDAFDELFWRYNHRLVGMARKRSPREDVEDILQFFWTEFLKYNRSYNPAYRFDKWLLCCFANATLAYYKKQHKEAQEPIPTDWEWCQQENAYLNLSTPLNMPDDRLNINAIQDAIGMLKGTQRDVIYATYFRGETLRQFAARQGMSLSNAHYHLQKALDHLRKEVA